MAVFQRLFTRLTYIICDDVLGFVRADPTQIIAHVHWSQSQYSPGPWMHQWGSGTWYPLDVAAGDETEHIIAQAYSIIYSHNTVQLYSMHVSVTKYNVDPSIHQ